MWPRAFVDSESTPSRPSEGAEPTANDAAGYAGPNSVTWRIAREYVVLLGAGRAVLMQLAHPLVAAGVLQHSSFLRDPLGRSYRTVEFTQVLAFGSRDEAHGPSAWAAARDSACLAGGFRVLCPRHVDWSCARCDPSSSRSRPSVAL